MKQLGLIIRRIFALSVMAKASHINASSIGSYAKHKAFGDFYEFVDELADRVSEHSIGMMYIPSVELSMLECTGDTIQNAMMVYKELYDFAEGIEDEALCNMCAEFHEAIGKLKYMNTFK